MRRRVAPRGRRRGGKALALALAVWPPTAGAQVPRAAATRPVVAPVQAPVPPPGRPGMGVRILAEVAGAVLVGGGLGAGGYGLATAGCRPRASSDPFGCEFEAVVVGGVGYFAGVPAGVAAGGALAGGDGGLAGAVLGDLVGVALADAVVRSRQGAGALAVAVAWLGLPLVGAVTGYEIAVGLRRADDRPPGQGRRVVPVPSLAAGHVGFGLAGTF